MNKRPFLHERSWSGGLNLWSIDFEVELIDFNTVSGKSHIIYGWDESELIFLYIITVSISDHEERRGGSVFQMIRTYICESKLTKFLYPNLCKRKSL